MQLSSAAPSCQKELRLLLSPDQMLSFHPSLLMAALRTLLVMQKNGADDGAGHNAGDDRGNDGQGHTRRLMVRSPFASMFSPMKHLLPRLIL